MGRISTISFPGLGIDEFTINGVALSFQIGDKPVTIMWYGIIICIGIFAGFAYFAYRARRAWIPFDDILDITLITVISAVIGARLYYVIFFGGFVETGGTFWENLGGTLYNIVAIWNGGLAIYGGIIAGALAVYLISRHKKIGFFKLADMAAPAVMLGQLIGRWGNFCNGEAFGSETTLPWRMGLCNAQTGYETIYVHPTFLYESLWNLIGFILINIFYKKRKYHGEVTLWYFAWYGLGRGFIELLRTDSLMLGSIRVSSLLSFLLFAVMIPLLIVLRVRYKKLLAAGYIEYQEVVTIPLLLGIPRRKYGIPKTEPPADSSAVQDMPSADAGEVSGSASQNTDSGDGDSAASPERKNAEPAATSESPAEPKGMETDIRGNDKQIGPQSEKRKETAGSAVNADPDDEEKRGSEDSLSPAAHDPDDGAGQNSPDEPEKEEKTENGTNH